MSSRLFANALVSLAVIALLSGCPVTTFPLQAKYVGENTKCVWQPATKCPPYVIYYNATQSASVALHVTNNLIYNANNVLFDTTGADPTGVTGTKAAIFAADAAGNLYASNQNKVYLFHHSTLMAGQPVVAAGEMQAKAGVITSVTNCSGHYKPATLTKDMVVKVLTAKGYTRSDFTFSTCSPAQLERYLTEHADAQEAVAAPR